MRRTPAGFDVMSLPPRRLPATGPLSTPGAILVLALVLGAIWLARREGNDRAERAAPRTEASSPRTEGPTSAPGTSDEAPAPSSRADSARTDERMPSVSDAGDAGAPERPRSERPGETSRSGADGPRGPPQTAGQPSREVSGQSRDDDATDADRERVIVRNVTIKDRGRVIYRGDVDLTPTLRRIAEGRSFPHRNDGSVFQNRESRLPKQPAGYYREYVHPTEEIDGPGPQRIVLGREGERYYTADHYQSFRRLP